MPVRTVGFVGLGIMGGPMAANLVKAGFDVVGHNRSRGKVDRLVVFGGGVPLVADGRTVGAIGVSGGSSEQDVRVAEAGAAAVG